MDPNDGFFTCMACVGVCVIMVGVGSDYDLGFLLAGAFSAAVGCLCLVE